MSMKWITSSLAVAALLVFSVSAFAKDNHSGSFDLSDTARIGSSQLAPGHYTAQWTGPANDVKINILKGNHTVATAEGHMKDLSKPAPYSAVVMDENTKAVNEIDFGNRTEALQIAE